MTKKVTNELEESGKDASRVTIFAAISTIVTYGINQLFPDLPGEVSAALLVIILAAITWLDSLIHHSKEGTFKNINGLLPW